MTWAGAAEDYARELATRPAARQPATLGEIWRAEWSAAGLGTLTGSGAPMEEARRELIDGVTGATGKTLAELAGERGVSLGAIATIEGQAEFLGGVIDALPEDKRKELIPLRDVRRRAAEKAQAIERAEADTYGAAYGMSGVGTAFLAGIARHAVDPLNVLTLPIGGPILKGPALKVLAREAGIGAGIQAMQEPIIQTRRAELGLAAGPGEAVVNVLEAGLGAAGLAGIFRGAVAVSRRALGFPRTVESGTQKVPSQVKSDAELPASADDFAAAAMVAERDQLIDAHAVPPSPRGRERAAVKIDEAAAAIETGRAAGALPKVPARPSEPSLAEGRASGAATFIDPAAPPAPAPRFAEGFAPERIAYFDGDRQELIRQAGGPRLPVRPAVVELGDLVISHNADGVKNPSYPAALQPRDRAAAASRAQVAEMAATLEPELLGRDPRHKYGAPVIGPDGVVESGNGRVLAIARAYDRHPERAAAYRTFLEEQGYQIEGFKFPVLVRVREGEIADRTVLGIEANVPESAGFSKPERAAMDARQLDDGLLSLYRGGEVSLAQNARFVRAFADRAVAPTERNDFVDGSGRLSADGARRLEAALVQRAWGAEDVTAALFQDIQPTSLAILGALADTAPAAARVRAAVAEQRVPAEADPTGDILDAFRLVERARATGQPVHLLVDQIDIEHGAVRERVRAFVRLYFNDDALRQAAGRDKVTARLADALNRALGEGQGPDLFAAAPLDAATIARAARLAGESLSEHPITLAKRPGIVRKAEIFQAVYDADWKRAAEAQPFVTIEEGIALAGQKQPRLVAELETAAAEVRRAAEAEGRGASAASVKDPGVKADQARIGDKAAEARGDPRQVTDLARAGVEIERPADAEPLLAALAARYLVIDRGWEVKPDGYFDRKLAVVFDDGLIAEVQLWPHAVVAAKSRGGEFYRTMRTPGIDDAAYEATLAQARAHWAAALGGLSDEWKAIYSAALTRGSVGGGPKRASSSPHTESALSSEVGSASKSSANRDAGPQPLSGESVKRPAGVSAASSPESLNQRIEGAAKSASEQKVSAEGEQIKAADLILRRNDIDYGQSWVGFDIVRRSDGRAVGNAIIDATDPIRPRVEWIGAQGFEQPNRFGPAAVRGLLRQFQEHFPQAVELQGARVSGSRFAGDVAEELPETPVTVRLKKPIGDQALARDAERALADAGGDLEIELAGGRVSARRALGEAEEDAQAARELFDCIGETTKGGGE